MTQQTNARKTEIADFAKCTGLSEEKSRKYLEDAEWNGQTAVDNFFKTCARIEEKRLLKERESKIDLLRREIEQNNESTNAHALAMELVTAASSFSAAANKPKKTVTFAAEDSSGKPLPGSVELERKSRSTASNLSLQKVHEEVYRAPSHDTLETCLEQFDWNVEEATDAFLAQQDMLKTQKIEKQRATKVGELQGMLKAVTQKSVPEETCEEFLKEADWNMEAAADEYFNRSSIQQKK